MMNSENTQEQAGLLSPQKEEDDDGQNDPSDHEETEKHYQILQETKSSMKAAIMLSTFLALVYSMRMDTFVLLSQTMTNDTVIISVVGYAGYFTTGFFALILGYLGGKWRYDLMFIIVCIIDPITFFLEASSYTFDQFGTVYAISGMPSQALTFGYLARMLPLVDCKKYQVYNMRFYALGVMLGPIFAGILSYFISYRSVYYCCFVISCFALMHCIGFIVNKQALLKKKQMTLINLYKQYAIDSDHDIDYDNKYNTINSNERLKWVVSNDYRFPVCLEATEDVTHHDHVRKSQTFPETSMATLSNYDKFVLGLFIISEGISMGIESSCSTWYNVYMRDKYNCSIIISMGQLSIMILFVWIGTQIPIYLTEKIHKIDANTTNENENNSESKANRYDFNNLYIRGALISSLIGILVSLCLFPNYLFFQAFDSTVSDEIGIILFWFYMAIMGLVWGSLFLTLDMIMLDLTPSNVAGIVGGIKTGANYFLGSIGILVTGLLWDSSHEYLWYIISILFTLSFVLVCIAANMECLKK